MNDQPHDQLASSQDKQVLRETSNWKDLYFYQKSEVLYQMTFAFCNRFLPKYGDRTVDQMIQAARSGKQNIVEGSEDGMTSTEMELKLINVARSSLQELREDYEDFVKSRHLKLWTPGHERYDRLLAFCRTHNLYSDYEPFVMRWSAEEFCNTAITLCHMTDKMICSYLDRLQKEFVTKGGIKERMYAARTGYRQQQDKLFEGLKRENVQLKEENNRLKEESNRLKEESNRLREENARLKEEVLSLRARLNGAGL